MVSSTIGSSHRSWIQTVWQILLSRDDLVNEVHPVVLVDLLV